MNRVLIILMFCLRHYLANQLVPVIYQASNFLKFGGDRVSKSLLNKQHQVDVTLNMNLHVCVGENQRHLLKGLLSYCIVVRYLKEVKIPFNLLNLIHGDIWAETQSMTSPLV